MDAGLLAHCTVHCPGSVAESRVRRGRCVMLCWRVWPGLLWSPSLRPAHDSHTYRRRRCGIDFRRHTFFVFLLDNATAEFKKLRVNRFLVTTLMQSSHTFVGIAFDSPRVRSVFLQFVCAFAFAPISSYLFFLQTQRPFSRTRAASANPPCRKKGITLLSDMKKCLSRSLVFACEVAHNVSTAKCCLFPHRIFPCFLSVSGMWVALPCER